MLKAQDLKFRRGNDVLFEHLNFVVHPGQSVAIAGRNGVGKSTLFELILAQLHAEEGDLSYPSDWRCAYMRQETTVTSREALEFVVDGHRELRRVETAIQTSEAQNDTNALAHLHIEYGDLGGYEAQAQAAEILHGLGFSNDDLNKAYKSFSGGWRIRLNLAQALMSPCDLLLLDEPTNHLDLEAIMWLESWLERFAGTILLIAHDRSFLDNCTHHTLYLSHASGKLYKGNYSSCERQRAEQLILQRANVAKQQAKAAHIQTFVDRFRAKASKAKQVQSRIKALEKLQIGASLHIDSPYNVNFQNPEKVSNPLFSLRDVDIGYAQTPVLRNVNQSILPGARIGVLGENGAGKSTLLKALIGELEPLAGELNAGQHSSTGYFAQHQLESLNAQAQPLQSMLIDKPTWTEQHARDYLGGWGFNGQMLVRPIATLSGGEKARFVLALLAAQRPAVLVLDEPTNHLDLDMRDALVMALQDYTGAVIIVSHDRSLLEKTVDEFWFLSQGQVHSFNGDMDDYIANIKTVPTGATGTQSQRTSSGKNQRQLRAQKRTAVSQLRKKIKHLEQELSTSMEQRQTMENQLADKQTYENLPTDELDALVIRAGRYRNKVEMLEEQWLELSTEMEEALHG